MPTVPVIRCFNCGTPAPSAAAQQATFRCFRCGAVTETQTGRAAGGEEAVAAAAGISLPPGLARARQGPVTVRRLTVYQRRALMGRAGTYFLYFLLAGVMGTLCVVLGKEAVSLSKLNDAWFLPWLGAAPAGVLLFAAVFSFWRMRTAQVAAQDLCSAIPPRTGGGPARCDLCGTSLPTKQFVELCPSCGSHNITAVAVTRRSSKREVDIDENAQRLITDETVLTLDRLRGAVTGAFVWIVVAPGLLLAAGGWLWFNGNWRIPTSDTRPYAIVRTPDCYMVIVSDGKLKDGLVGVAKKGGLPLLQGNIERSRYRGMWVKEKMEVAVNELLAPTDFVGRRVKTAGAPDFGDVTAVYQWKDNTDAQLLIDLDGQTFEGPLEQACVDIAVPYHKSRLEAELVLKKETEAQKELPTGAQPAAPSLGSQSDPLKQWRRPAPKP